MLYGNEKSKNGQCEVCDKDNIRVVEHYGNMWFCPECWQLEVKASIENMAPLAQDARVQAYKDSYTTRVIETAKVLDESVEVKSDIFNAATHSIDEMKKAIDADASIENKPYALAEFVISRAEHFKKVIFDAQNALIEANTNQKAIQVYLNNLANKLRADEREKLKIADISYQPAKIKAKVAKISTTGTSSKVQKDKPKKVEKVKIDKAEIRRVAATLGIDEFTLQMIVVSKGCTVEQAAAVIRRKMSGPKE